MALQEFYIRNESDTEARGPLTLEQLISLAEAGQVTNATLYYDINTEQWVALSANAEVLAAVFPAKKKLTLKTKQEIKTLNKEVEGAAPITVDDMLAAAEGKTADTAGKADPAESMARAAAIGRYGAIVTLLLAAAGEILPSYEAVISLDPAQLLAHPLLLLGALDLLLAVVLGLGVLSLYPFVRFRAALALGFLGFIFWTQGQHLPLLAIVGGSAGLYLCTVFVSYLPVIVAAAAGVAGTTFVAWHLLSV